MPQPKMLTAVIKRLLIAPALTGEGVDARVGQCRDAALYAAGRVAKTE